MKQKDITVIVFIVIISTVISFILSNAVISSPKNRQQKVEVVEAISPNFNRPDAKYFNKDSVNATQKVQIGGDPNTKPFNGGQ